MYQFSTLVLYCLLIISGVTHSEKREEPKKNKKEPSITKVVLLGTGTPIADPDRSGPAVAIVVNNQTYLFDCGPGVVRRAVSAATKLNIPDLTPSNLNTLFITHLHSDHTAGYPDLFLSTAVLDRPKPLKIFGPKGSKKMHHHIAEAYAEDIHTRLTGLEKGNPEAYKAEIFEIDKDDTIYRDNDVKIIAFKVNHGSWENAWAYKVITPDKSIVISGDCTYSESLIQYAKNCDILIHEVYSQDGWSRKSPNWQKYHAAFHTSTAQLASIANQAKPGLVILYHQLFWDSTEERMLSEIKKIYSGKLVSGKDLDLF